MKRSVLLVIAFLLSVAGFSQGKFYTKTGRIVFFSTTTMENIEAVNKSVVVLLDTKSGDLQFSVLMKGFEFKKALMQEHFNKNYVESHKYPKAEFKGQVMNNAEIKYGTDGNYPVKVKGKLSIHGQSRDVETPGTIIIKDGKLSMNSIFNITVADYNISISKIHRDNIAKTIQVTVNCNLNPL